VGSRRGDEAVEQSLDADLCLFVCGEPAFMRGASYAGKVRALAGRLRRTRVVFPGYLGPERKKAYFRLADLFVSPSIHESYGLSVVEAMKAGLPVLASHQGGLAEVVRHEVDGELFTPGDAADLSAPRFHRMLLAEASPGNHEVCAFARNDGGGSVVAMGCRKVAVTG